MIRRSRTGISLLHMLIACVALVAALNLISAVYTRSVALMRFVSRRCEDLQGLDLMLQDLKRDAARAARADITPGKLTLHLPENRTEVYTFSGGVVSRNGVRYHPQILDFRAACAAPDLLGIHVQLLPRRGRPGPVVSTMVCMRNANETP